MQTRNGRRIIRRKKTTKVKTRVVIKDAVVVDAASKEEEVVVVVVKVVAEDKVVATTKDAGNTMVNIFGNFAQPISTVQLEKLQEPEEAEVDAMVEEAEVMDVEDMNLTTQTVMQLVTVTYLHLRITVVHKAHRHQYLMCQ